MSILFKDDQFDFQVLRLLGETVYGAADIGEVVSTSNMITGGVIMTVGVMNGLKLPKDYIV
jgi:hypothetical protein